MLRRSVAPVWHAMCAFRAAASRACEAPLTGVMDSQIQRCTWADISIRGARAGVKRFWRPLILAVVAGVLYASVLVGLIRQWHYDANYSHGFLVPVFVGYLIWRKREALGSLRFGPIFVGIFGVIGVFGSTGCW